MLRVGDLINLDIERMSYGSGGIGRHEGLVVFVPYSAPGDQLQARVVESRKGFCRAEIVKMLSPGPSRVRPDCKYHGFCGGCPWQQLGYEEQLIQKKNIVLHALSGFAGLPVPKVLPSPKIWRHRHRVRFKVKQGQFGYNKFRSHDFVAIDDCLISHEALVGKAKLLLHTDKKIQQLSAGELELKLEKSGAVTQRLLAEEAGQFSQSNEEMNEKLVDTVVDWSLDTKPAYVYDLYCGDGNFSFPLIERLKPKQFIGIEANNTAIQSAQKRLSVAGLGPKSSRFFSGRVEVVLSQIGVPASSLVLLDPPRSGCHELVIKYLAQSRIEHLIYVSCDPPSLARDLKRFFERLPDSSRSHYHINHLYIFDLFPHTDHIEVAVDIRRRKDEQDG